MKPSGIPSDNDACQTMSDGTDDSDKTISNKEIQESLNIVADIPHYEYNCFSSSHTNLVQTKQTQKSSRDPNEREYACSTSGLNKEGNGPAKDGKKRSSIATTNLGDWERSDTSVVSNDRPDDVI